MLLDHNIILWPEWIKKQFSGRYMSIRKRLIFENENEKMTKYPQGLLWHLKSP